MTFFIAGMIVGVEVGGLVVLLVVALVAVVNYDGSW
jgi:hypothetical protein